MYGVAGKEHTYNYDLKYSIKFGSNESNLETVSNEYKATLHKILGNT